MICLLLITLEQLKKAKLRITMPDHSKWDVPIIVIAKNRAKYYANEFSGFLQASLDEDTWPLFLECSDEITDWAGNNMDWDEVAKFATLVQEAKESPDYQEGWVNGNKEMVFPND